MVKLGSGVSAQDTAVVTLVRIRPKHEGQVEVDVAVDESLVEQNLEQLVYTGTNNLSAGAYTFKIQVADRLGNTRPEPESVTFAIEGLNPTVVITAPASGQTFDESPESITGFFAGGGEVSVTKFTVNGTDQDITSDGNKFTYMPAEGFSEGDHMVNVEVTDGSGLMAETSLTFTVELPVPTVSIASPAAGSTHDHEFSHIAGEFSGVGDVTIKLMVGDMEVATVKDGNQFTAEYPDKLAEGDHTVSVMITDGNEKTANASAAFSIVYPTPTVSITAPAAGSTHDHEFSHIAGEFSGVGDVKIKLMVGDMEVATVKDGNQFTAEYPDKLAEGDHTVSVMITDGNEKTASASTAFSIVYPDAMVSITAPAAGSIHDHEFSHIAGEFTGVGDVTIKLMVGDKEVATVKDGNQFTAEYPEKLAEGDHTVSVMITDGNEKTASASAAFSIVYPTPMVSITAPAAGSTHDHEFSHIAGEFSWCWGC